MMQASITYVRVSDNNAIITWRLAVYTCRASLPHLQSMYVRVSHRRSNAWHCLNLLHNHDNNCNDDPKYIINPSTPSPPFSEHVGRRSLVHKKLLMIASYTNNVYAYIPRRSWWMESKRRRGATLTTDCCCDVEACRNCRGSSSLCRRVCTVGGGRWFAVSMRAVGVVESTCAVCLSFGSATMNTVPR